MLTLARNFVTKYAVAFLVVIIVSLGITTKWALDTKEAVQADLVRAEQSIDRIASDLAQERRNARTLADALASYQRRSQELNEANERLSLELRNALNQNTTWSRGAVPSAVTDSLCQQLNCVSDPE